jgi:outer membrane protein assembly factor BamB
MISKQLQAAVALGVAMLLTACEGPGASPVTTLHSAPSSRSVAENASQQSVTYQVDTEHTGFAHGQLRRPLQQLWSVSLGGTVSYPVIANGIVVVAANDQLIALNEKTGKVLWTQGSPSGDGWVGPAYDNGKIFADPSYASSSDSLGMYAFDERTGKQTWASAAPGQYAFSSPPTAASGTVYTGAAGGGGTVYAYDESSGALKWTASVENGDNSSPVVTSNGIFVSYACPQTYDFQPNSGQPIWHFSGPCEGGGGSTPALYDGLLFVGDSDQSSGYNGLILHAKNGTVAGGFNASFTPAFSRNLGFFVNYSTVEAESIPKMKQAWTVNLGSSNHYTTPALVVGNIVYVATAANSLVGYDVNTGKQKVTMPLAYTGYNRNGLAGLAFADGELIVPNGPYLVSFTGR